MAGLSAVILAAGIAYLRDAIPYWTSAGIWGCDYTALTGAASRWLTGGGFYVPYQVAGPYEVAAHTGADSPIMYPPTMLLLFVPFTILPALLWWLIPLAVTAWVVASHRPRPLVWPVLALLALFPMTLWAVATGNPTLWMMAAVALGTRYGWPAVVLVLKPTLAPFALIGITGRSWWLALAALALLSLAFLPMWADYLAVASNVRTPMGALYSFNHVPALLIPVVAWLGRSERRPRRTSSVG
jgi:hypothetical protein